MVSGLETRIISFLWLDLLAKWSMVDRLVMIVLIVASRTTHQEVRCWAETL
jgi:hypothetical protein